MIFLESAEAVAIAFVIYLVGHYIGYKRGLRAARRRPVSVADFTEMSRRS